MTHSPDKTNKLLYNHFNLVRAFWLVRQRSIKPQNYLSNSLSSINNCLQIEKLVFLRPLQQEKDEKHANETPLIVK